MYKQGDIVKVPFPFSDDTGSKARPAVIISNDFVNNTSDVILAQITAKPRNDKFTFNIENSDVDTPLPVPCQIRCHKITIIDKRKIDRKITSLKPAKQTELFNKIIALLKTPA